MTRRRWIADEHQEDRASLLGQNAAHLSRVLRARKGEEYDIVCEGSVRVGTIDSITEERVEFTLGEVVATRQERETILLMAVYKFDRMEWAIEKCTELGATRIIPVIARRTDAHLASSAAKRVERWRRIAHEAAQQSRRRNIPTIEDPMKFKEAVALKCGLRLLLNENERSKNIFDFLQNYDSEVAFAVGPEGGWTDEELLQFGAEGWQSVTLGSQILRAETAAIAAAAAASMSLR
jgi:16S rRNA (uracil1498-N3)-methyltransferase